MFDMLLMDVRNAYGIADPYHSMYSVFLQMFLKSVAPVNFWCAVVGNVEFVPQKSSWWQ